MKSAVLLFNSIVPGPSKWSAALPQFVLLEWGSIAMNFNVDEYNLLKCECGSMSMNFHLLCMEWNTQ